jgi:ATP-dependent protease HslVU (ClpYQ) peptidase subunit
MTCIIGLIDNGNVYIGGDSAGVSGLSVTIRADEKVFQNGPFIFGFTSSFRMGQLLRYKFDPPAQTVNQGDMEYMVTSFIDAVRQCFAANGFGDKDATRGGTFLAGYKGKLYNIDSDFQVGIPSDNFDAVGCGAELALGAMFATENMKPEDRITTALGAASYFSGGVAPPFRIIHTVSAKPPAKKKSAKKTAKKK